MQLLGLFLQLVKAAFGIGVDGVLGVLANVELGLDLLRGTHDALLKALETHGDRRGSDETGIGEGRMVKKV